MRADPPPPASKSWLATITSGPRANVVTLVVAVVFVFVWMAWGVATFDQWNTRLADGVTMRGLEEAVQAGDASALPPPFWISHDSNSYSLSLGLPTHCHTVRTTSMRWGEPLRLSLRHDGTGCVLDHDVTLHGVPLIRSGATWEDSLAFARRYHALLKEEGRAGVAAGGGDGGAREATEKWCFATSRDPRLAFEPWFHPICVTMAGPSFVPVKLFTDDDGWWENKELTQRLVVKLLIRIGVM